MADLQSVTDSPQEPAFQAFSAEPPEWLPLWLRPGTGKCPPEERLQRLLAAWPELPEPIKAAIAAMVGAACPEVALPGDRAPAGR